MAFDREKVLDKIEKLLSLANKAGSPEEAAASLAKAHELLMKHQLEMAEVYSRIKSSDFGLYYTRVYSKWSTILAQAVQLILPVRAMARGTNVGFAGTEEDVRVATMIFTYLYDTMEYGVKRLYRKTRKSGEQTSGLKTSYRAGFTYMVHQRAQEMATAIPDNVTTALAPVNRALIEFVSQYGTRKTRVNVTQENYMGFEAGIEAGKSVKLNDPRKEIDS